jgi:hypothetical protein
LASEIEKLVEDAATPKKGELLAEVQWLGEAKAQAEEATATAIAENEKLQEAYSQHNDG